MPHVVTASPALSGKQVVFVSVLHVKHGFEKLILDELLPLIRRSREEAGCLLFDLYRLTGNPAHLFLHEVWESRDALEAHSGNLHTTRFRTSVSSYLERPIEFLEVQEVM